MPNSTRPPYIATEYSPAPRAVVGGRNHVPKTPQEQFPSNQNCGCPGLFFEGRGFWWIWNPFQPRLCVQWKHGSPLKVFAMSNIPPPPLAAVGGRGGVGVFPHPRFKVLLIFQRWHVNCNSMMEFADSENFHLLCFISSVHNSPTDDMKTTPNPMARGPPMFKNFSLGAQIASVDRPATCFKPVGPGWHQNTGRASRTSRKIFQTKRCCKQRENKEQNQRFRCHCTPREGGVACSVGGGGISVERGLTLILTSWWPVGEGE